MVLSHNPAMAADLVQETYLRALKAKESLRPDSNVKSWLFTILRNIWLNQLRHERVLRSSSSQCRLAPSQSLQAPAELIAKHHTLSAYQVGQVYAYRGESEKSFEWLKRAYEQRDAGMTEMSTDPLLKNLRRDQRYTALPRKLRLPATE